MEGTADPDPEAGGNRHRDGRDSETSRRIPAPPPIKLKGIQQLLRIEQLNRRLNGEAVQVSEFLQAEGYACTILKGQGIARYYPNPLHRMPGDIDVWPDAEPDVHIPVDTRSAFPVISVQSPVSIQYRWQS